MGILNQKFDAQPALQSGDCLSRQWADVLLPSYPASIGIKKATDDEFFDFEQAFTQTSCRISYDQRPESGYGGYQAFLTYPENGGATYLNTIFLNKDREHHLNTISEWHEKIHAIQFDRIPELHASPYNMLAHEDVPIILSPRSWVLAMLLIEREAYAKTAWLAKIELERTYCPDLSRAARAEIVNPDDVAYWSVRFPDDIGFALGEASLVWDDKIKAKRNCEEPDKKLRDHYIESAIRLYESSYRLHHSPTAAAPVFVDLCDRGILALGASFGPSIFGRDAPDPVFRDLKLNPQQERRIRALEQKFGIDPGASLPNLRSVLAERGLSAESYMQLSKGFIDVVPDFKNEYEHLSP